jgi:hypothetical protein
MGIRQTEGFSRSLWLPGDLRSVYGWGCPFRHTKHHADLRSAPPGVALNPPPRSVLLRRRHAESDRHRPRCLASFSSETRHALTTVCSLIVVSHGVRGAPSAPTSQLRRTRGEEGIANLSGDPLVEAAGSMLAG